LFINFQRQEKKKESFLLGEGIWSSQLKEFTAYKTEKKKRTKKRFKKKK
jgi:hypothetical protein